MSGEKKEGQNAEKEEVCSDSLAGSARGKRSAWTKEATTVTFLWRLMEEEA